MAREDARHSLVGGVPDADLLIVAACGEKISMPGQALHKIRMGKRMKDGPGPDVAHLDERTDGDRKLASVRVKGNDVGKRSLFQPVGALSRAEIIEQNRPIMLNQSKGMTVGRKVEATAFH